MLALAQEKRQLQEKLDALNKQLLAAHAAGRRVILVVDEAQTLSRDVLEQVRLLQPVEKQVIQAIQEIGKEKGFSVILDRGAPGVVYHRDSLDITDLVVKRLNEG